VSGAVDHNQGQGYPCDRGVQVRWSSTAGSLGDAPGSVDVHGSVVAAAGAAPVEAEHELVHVAGQVGGFRRALMGAQQPPLDQRGDPVYRGEQRAGVLSAGAGGPLAAPVVDVAERVQPAVALPGIGDYRGSRLDVVGDEGMRRVRGRIGQRRHPAPADPLRLADLDSDAGQDLLAPGAPAAQPRLLPADIGLIHLHRAGQSISARPHQYRPQSMQDRPRGLVRADLQRPLQTQRGDTVLAGGEQPTEGEPHRQRRARPVEDRARRRRGAHLAAGALEPPIAQPPAPGVAAVGADEAARPPQPLQVVQVVRIAAEPGLELTHRPRVMQAGHKVEARRKLLRLHK